MTTTDDILGVATAGLAAGVALHVLNKAMPKKKKKKGKSQDLSFW